MRCKSICFSPTGRSFSVACASGLSCYSLDDSLVFDPFDLDLELTNDTIVELVRKSKCFLSEVDWTLPLIMALRLNDPAVIQLVYENIPNDHIEVVVRSLPAVYVDKVIKVIAILLETSSTLTKEEAAMKNNIGYVKSPHLEFHLHFFCQILQHHGSFIKENFFSHHSFSTSSTSHDSFYVLFRAIKKSILSLRNDLSKLCDENDVLLRFLVSFKEQTMPVKEQKELVNVMFKRLKYNHDDYDNGGGETNCTKLAEDIANEYNLCEDDADATIPEEVFDAAVEADERYQKLMDDEGEDE
jgi:periodic tryptophan protein 2